MMGTGLAKNTSVKTFQLCATNISNPKNMQALTAKLKDNKSLETLDLSDNWISNEAAFYLLQMIKFKSE